MSNIDDMFDLPDDQEKLIFFFKNEGTPIPQIDPDIVKNSKIIYKDPLQIFFMVGGEAKAIYHGETKNEILGIQTYLLNKSMWSALLKEITKLSDSEIRRGCLIDLEHDKDHSFFINGFKNKEDVIGCIQQKYKGWMKQIDRFLNYSCPELRKTGDEQISHRGVQGKLKEVK